MLRMLLIALLLTMSVPALAEDMSLIMDFSSMDSFSPITFPKIKRHTTYSIGTEGDITFVHAIANASASALAITEEFDVYNTPILRWRWRISNVLAKGDGTRKIGDDYPARLYIMFSYELKDAPLMMRLTYGMARNLYGQYPPHSSLSYVWANRPHDTAIIISPYTDRSRMIPLQAGDKHLGQWIEEEVNILDDYQKAFGTAPPNMARIAIMTDTDNTGEYAEAWYAKPLSDLK